MWTYVARLDKAVSRLGLEKTFVCSLSYDEALSAFVKTLSYSGALGAHANQILYLCIIHSHGFSHDLFFIVFYGKRK
jgi:hypothetical protein